ncbi:MAG TPA: helix-turn-helix transcriptional regulator, partial [Candidatus Dormibacteraeota bacterium]
MTGQLPIGQRIMRYRVRAGLSRAQLSGLIGKSPSWLYKVERGVLMPDRLSVLSELATVLRVDISELAGAPVPTALLSPTGPVPRLIAATAPHEVEGAAPRARIQPAPKPVVIAAPPVAIEHAPEPVVVAAPPVAIAPAPEPAVVAEPPVAIESAIVAAPPAPEAPPPPRLA